MTDYQERVPYITEQDAFFKQPKAFYQFNKKEMKHKIRTNLGSERSHKSVCQRDVKNQKQKQGAPKLNLNFSFVQSTISPQISGVREQSYLIKHRAIYKGSRLKFPISPPLKEGSKGRRTN